MRAVTRRSLFRLGALAAAAAVPRLSGAPTRGVTDDTEWLQDYADTCAMTGKPFVLESGRFRLSKTLVLRKGIPMATVSDCHMTFAGNVRTGLRVDCDMCVITGCHLELLASDPGSTGLMVGA